MVNPGRKKILFLFSELAGYIVACMKHLGATRDVDVHVVRWPVNSVAPFQFSLEGRNLNFYQREKYDEQQLIQLAEQINPDVIICSGWMDKGYNAVCRKFYGKVRTVMILDNPWRNTIKQHMAGLVGPLFLNRIFSDCWVPGSPQLKYARRLGFKKDRISEGIYSCDYESFHNQYIANREAKTKSFPKRIIFVGRYTKLKGTAELWKAFVRFQELYPSEWELWCLGKGDMGSDFPKHDKIKDFGFVQPAEMEKFIAECGVFILPSHYEHWGVVVHEFAAAGFPLICTTSTGAATAFLREGENGYFARPESVDSLLEIFRKITTLPAEELLRMSDRSAEISNVITPETWTRTCLEFLNN